MKLDKSLRGKLVILVAASCLGLALAVFLGVSFIQYRQAQSLLADIERNIETQLTEKGHLLAQSHGVAFRNLVTDNAFGDVARIVSGTVEGDTDIIYGTFVDTDGKPWIYADEAHPKGVDDAAEPVKALGIPPLAGDAQQGERRVSQGGTDVIEVSARVSQGDESLGLLTYGVSRARAVEATLKARRESTEALLSVLAVVGLLIVGVGAVAVTVASRAAGSLSRPVEELTAAAQKLATGDRSVHVAVKTGDELERLGDAFNKMVDDLARSYAQLEELNKGLEDRVAQRTAELAAKNREMRAVFDNVDQGFLTAQLDGTLSSQRSRRADELFGGAPGAADTLPSLFGRFSPAAEAGASAGLMQAAENFLPIEASLSVMPQHLSAESREIELAYVPLTNESGDVTSLLVVASDVTERRLRERTEAQQKESMEIFGRVREDARGFSAQVAELRGLVQLSTEELTTQSARAEDARDLTVLKRVLHTVKGNASFMGLRRIASVCQHMEDVIAEGELPVEAEVVSLRELDRWLGDELERFGGQRDVIEVEKGELESVLKLVVGGGSQDDVARALENWALEPVRRPLRRLGEEGKKLAKKLKKAPVELVVDDHDVRLAVEGWSEFWSGLVHVVRNAVDHGIEDEAERAATEKSPQARLELTAERADQAIVVRVADDGRGVDWDRLAAKAKQHGLPAKTHEDLVGALFYDGLSTRDAASETSGRGVGLSAVKELCERRGGRVEVDSRRGYGTTFRFVIPLQA